MVIFGYVGTLKFYYELDPALRLPRISPDPRRIEDIVGSCAFSTPPPPSPFSLNVDRYVEDIQIKAKLVAGFY